MDMFSFTRFCLRVLADLNEIIRRMKRNVILTIAIYAHKPRYKFFGLMKLVQMRLGCHYLKS
jgi:hypothetical protein